MKKSEEQPFGELWVLNTLWATLNEDERLWVKERIEVVHYNKNDIK